MKIFNYEHGQLTLNQPEILLIKEFKRVWELDKTKDKKKAYRLFQYAYLVLDWTSPYKEYSDEDKMETAMKDSGVTQKEIDHESSQEMFKKYNEIKNSNKIIRYIKSSWLLLDKLEEYAMSVDLTETILEGPQKGKLVHSVRDARDTVKQMPELIAKARELRDLLAEEMKEEVNTRGGVEPPRF